MHRLFAVVLALILPLGLGALAGQPAGPSIDSARYLAHVRYLASDELQGRGNGSPGLERAGDYIAAALRTDGLAPAVNDTYFQPFEIVTGLEIRDGNLLSLTAGDSTATFELGRTYVPLSVSAIPTTTAAAGSPTNLAVVFGGYGISAPALKYDDYAGLDVTGKAVLVLTHEPQEDDEKSPFDGRVNTHHASLMQKAMVARAHGASLMLLVADPAHPSDDANYAGWVADPQADDFGITVLRVNRDVALRVLAGRDDILGLAKQIDADLTPRSRALAGVAVHVRERFAKVRRQVRNVVAVLPGSDPALAGETVVIGAHYDHLGWGGRHSLAPDSAGQIHNGADDNASGTAALLEIARAAAASRAAFPRTLVFAAFAGEELGLLGSQYYVAHPVRPLEQTVAMVNLDMVGRPNGRILVSGLDTTPSFDADLKAAGKGLSLDVRAFREGAGVGASDDTSFVLRHIPSVAFFSGFHADYHRPSDDWDRIDAQGAIEVATLALNLVKRIAARAERPEFSPPVPTAHQGTAPAGQGSGTGGYGAYFGSVPDFGEGESAGVRFADVRADSPADKAGLKRGDVLVKFGGKPIRTLYDFTFALRSHRPGDKLPVTVIRDGKEVTVDVELGRRQ
jgi:Peptidase family M28/PDZ domain/PA domain